METLQRNQLIAKHLTQRVNIPRAAWFDPDGSGHYLKSNLELNGTAFHVEAIEITTDDQGWQTAHDPVWHRSIEHLQAITEGRMQTTRFDGREYLILITPYCR